MMNFADYKKQYERYLNLVTKYLQEYLLITYIGNYEVLHDKTTSKYHVAKKFLDYMFYDAYIKEIPPDGSTSLPANMQGYPYYHFYDPTHLDNIFLKESLLKNTWLRFRLFIDHDYCNFIENAMHAYKDATVCFLELLPILCQSIGLPTYSDGNLE